MLYSGKLDHLEFCKIAREKFDLDAVEYVNSFFFDKAEDFDYLKEMKNRANDHGVSSLLIKETLEIPIKKQEKKL